MWEYIGHYNNLSEYEIVNCCPYSVRGSVDEIANEIELLESTAGDPPKKNNFSKKNLSKHSQFLLFLHNSRLIYVLTVADSATAHFFYNHIIVFVCAFHNFDPNSTNFGVDNAAKLLS